MEYQNQSNNFNQQQNNFIHTYSQCPFCGAPLKGNEHFCPFCKNMIPVSQKIRAEEIKADQIEKQYSAAQMEYNTIRTKQKLEQQKQKSTKNGCAIILGIFLFFIKLLLKPPLLVVDTAVGDGFTACRLFLLNSIALAMLLSTFLCYNNYSMNIKLKQGGFL